MTVKLITRHPDGKNRCHTHARSATGTERDQTITEYEIDTGKNTGFDDLVKDASEGKYMNERPDWRRFYRSAIVVPIRYAEPMAIGAPGALNEIGFLAVARRYNHTGPSHFFSPG